jgi:hypothetical protein
VTTRREAVNAVIEAARAACGAVIYGKTIEECNERGTALGAIRASVRALDACTEPDLDALNAAVAEAVEAHARRHPASFTERPAMSTWGAIADARNARRAAMTPKPRYTSHNHEVLRDGEWYLSAATRERAIEVAALLNASATVKP